MRARAYPRIRCRRRAGYAGRSETFRRGVNSSGWGRLTLPGRYAPTTSVGVCVCIRAAPLLRSVPCTASGPRPVHAEAVPRSRGRPDACGGELVLGTHEVATASRCMPRFSVDGRTLPTAAWPRPLVARPCASLRLRTLIEEKRLPCSTSGAVLRLAQGGVIDELRCLRKSLWTSLAEGRSMQIQASNSRYTWRPHNYMYSHS
jgi:hypothetical protein